MELPFFVHLLLFSRYLLEMRAMKNLVSTEKLKGDGSVLAISLNLVFKLVSLDAFCIQKKNTQIWKTQARFVVCIIFGKSVSISFSLSRGK